MTSQNMEVILIIKKNDDYDQTYLTQNLMEGINRLNIDSAEVKNNDKRTPDAKGLDPLWGSVFIALGAPALTELIKFLASWVTHHKNPVTIKLGQKSTFELSLDPDTSPEKLEELLKIVKKYQK